MIKTVLTMAVLMFMTGINIYSETTAEKCSLCGMTGATKGDYHSAIADLTKSIELKPNFASAYYHWFLKLL